jgi:hypothetical protein
MRLVMVQLDRHGLSLRRKAKCLGTDFGPLKTLNATVLSKYLREGATHFGTSESFLRSIHVTIFCAQITIHLRFVSRFWRRSCLPMSTIKEKKRGSMYQKIYLFMSYLCISFFVLGASAQTVTTNGGTTNTVPKFSGATTVVNSAVTENNGQVGIGTTNPQATLHVSGNNTPGVLVEAQDSVLLGTAVCCGAGPTGSSIGSSAGWSSFYNGMFLDSNGTAAGASAGSQINTTVPSWRMALGSGTNEWPGGDNFVVARVPAGGNYAAPAILLKVDNGGLLHTSGGLIFPDGSKQTTALPAKTVAVCGQTGSACVGGCNICPSGFTGTNVGAPCQVTSDTGSCSQPVVNSSNSVGVCAVCRPQ